MEHPIAVSYLRWIVLLPLLGAAVNGLLGATLQKRFGKPKLHKLREIAIDEIPNSSGIV